MSTLVQMVVRKALALLLSNLPTTLVTPFSNSMVTIGKGVLLKSARIDLPAPFHLDAADLVEAGVALEEDLEGVADLALEVVVDSEAALEAVVAVEASAAATLDLLLVALTEELLEHPSHPILSPITQPLAQREARLSTFET